MWRGIKAGPTHHHGVLMRRVIQGVRALMGQTLEIDFRNQKIIFFSMRVSEKTSFFMLRGGKPNLDPVCMTENFGNLN